jgi:hypothetical protein
VALCKQEVAGPISAGSADEGPYKWWPSDSGNGLSANRIRAIGHQTPERDHRALDGRSWIGTSAQSPKDSSWLELRSLKALAPSSRFVRMGRSPRHARGARRGRRAGTQAGANQRDADSSFTLRPVQGWGSLVGGYKKPGVSETGDGAQWMEQGLK